MELIVNHVYEAKKPATVGVFERLLNDRMIIWIGVDTVQYDSPTVRQGRRYPTTTKKAFMKWAGRDVTTEMPAGEWRNAVLPNDAFSRGAAAPSAGTPGYLPEAER